MKPALLLPLVALLLVLCLVTRAEPPRQPSPTRFHDSMPAYVLDGIMRAESGGRADAVGDDGISIGAYQINELFHAERAAKFGEYDPRDPGQARRVARLILAENYAALGVWDWAIAAYRQGVTGVRRDGPTGWYLERVRGGN